MLDSGPGRLVTYLVAAVLMLALGVRVFGGAKREPTPAPVRIVAGAGAAPTPVDAEERVWVDVAGAVRRPGLYRVPADARVGQVVERAGGLHHAGSGAVNLAAPVEDGQQIVIARRGAGAVAADAPVATGAAEAPDGSAAPDALQAPAEAAHGSLSLATATAEEIDAAAEGIGPTLATRVVEFRTRAGGFASVEDLRQVPGIGEVRFQALADAFGP
jgi:competence protein ComEA